MIKQGRHLSNYYLGLILAICVELWYRSRGALGQFWAQWI